MEYVDFKRMACSHGNKTKSNNPVAGLAIIAIKCVFIKCNFKYLHMAERYKYCPV